jgi:hypothetical protein
MKLLYRSHLVALALLLGGMGQASAAPVFANPSFEVDSYCQFTPVVTGWVRGGSNTSFPGGMNNVCYGATPYGSQFVVLAGLDDGGPNYLAQTVSGFTVGDTYQLSFALSSEFSDGSIVHVSFDAGSSTPQQTFSAVPFPGGIQYWYTWETKTMNFLATATAVTFHIDSVPDHYEAGVDNFQLALVGDGVGSVPEPASLALLGIGLAGLGFSRRRTSN